MSISAKQFKKKLKALASDDELKKHERYFKFVSNKQSTDDYFIGVRMGRVFELAKEFIEMPVGEIEELLESPIHEARAGAVSIMDFQARSKKAPETQRKELFDLYIRRHDRINNWDLVDRSAIYVVGGWLFDKARDILYKLARSKNMWERRTAIVSTAYFIKNNDVAETFRIAEILAGDNEDLVNKGTGWMLRYAGDRDRPQLLNFLDKHAATLPRVLLRYSIEKLDKKKREHYLNLKAKKRRD